MKQTILNVILTLLCTARLYTQNIEYSDLHNRKVDSLQQILKANPTEKTKLLDVYWNLSWCYLKVDDYENMKEYASKGVALAEKTGNLYILADLYNNIGVAYDYVSKIDSAMLYFDKAQETVVRLEKSAVEKPEKIANIKGFIYGSIANLYSVQGKSQEALRYYFKALDLFEKYHIDNEMANVLGNIGATYLDIDNYEQAEIYFLIKEKLCRKTGNQPNLAHSLAGLGYVYLYKKDYTKARLAVEEAIGIYKSDPQPANLLSCHQCLSSVWLMESGNDVKAMEYASLALQEAKELDIPLEVSRSLLLKSEIYLFRKNYAIAEKTALEALQTDSTHLPSNQILYECLAKANIGMGNVDMANFWFDRHKQSQITYSNMNFQLQLSEMEVKYETEKKETQIAMLENEKRLIILLSIAIGAVLMLALAAFFFLWRWTVQKKRLDEHRIATQAVLDGEVQERTRLARDLHDGLGSMLASIKVNLQNAKREILGESKHYSLAINILDDSMKELRRIAHHLMPELLMRCGLKTSLETFCQSIPNTEFYYFGEDTRFDSKLETLIYRSAHELIYNALKHAEASQTNVQLIQESERISLTVQDNGKGFDPSRKTVGMGLNNIRQRVAVFNGEFCISSELGNGTEINMEFHLNPDSNDKSNNH
ncbi:MAG: sensor histidine kinase [Dysgonamonadaceae bacterium]|jgi:signal transduction histidine kinase/Tfp pilus assembly protein PilF|nr:sensor histidine kinase [Dysgonamonadaceae bacterium]